MTTFLVIAGVVAAVYIFGAIGFYYSFKHFPMLGGASSSAAPAKGQRLTFVKRNKDKTS